MISMFLNCAKVWTRLVRFVYRVGGRPPVTLSRAPKVVQSGTVQR